MDETGAPRRHGVLRALLRRLRELLPGAAHRREVAAEVGGPRHELDLLAAELLLDPRAGHQMKGPPQDDAFVSSLLGEPDYAWRRFVRGVEEFEPGHDPTRLMEGVMAEVRATLGIATDLVGSKVVDLYLTEQLTNLMCPHLRSRETAAELSHAVVQSGLGLFMADLEAVNRSVVAFRRLDLQD